MDCPLVQKKDPLVAAEGSTLIGKIKKLKAGSDNGCFHIREG